MLKNRFVLLALAVAMSFASCQKDQSTAPAKPVTNQLINFTPAKTSAELIALRADKSANLIRTMEEFDAAVTAQNTPLAKLSPLQLSSFKNSIVVRKNIGVVSFNYESLEESLSYEEFSTVLSLFGLDVKQGFWGLSNDPAVQSKLSPPSDKLRNLAVGDEIASSVAEDHAGYLCSTTIPNTCKKAPKSICLSGC